MRSPIFQSLPRIMDETITERGLFEKSCSRGLLPPELHSSAVADRRYSYFFRE
jgi:hypothetical protein